ncbi:tyrosine-protein phosphatase non-receptor type 13-like [Narcine bancroftii]|uniref:tyrosine-protein phosphatase non-receptor type 13-like n=1 Tax=Narcine bancroftii TaxID=1343680 RepID=UPI003831D845
MPLQHQQSGLGFESHTIHQEFVHFPWVSVNDFDVTNISHENAINLLQVAPLKLTLVVGRAAQNLLPALPLEKIPDIILQKGPNRQLGLKLTGGIGSKWQGIYVLEIVPNSPASLEGSLQPRDKILYICDICTMGMTLADAVRACDTQNGQITIKATRDGKPVITEVHMTGTASRKKTKSCLALKVHMISPNHDLAIKLVTFVAKDKECN